MDEFDSESVKEAICVRKSECIEDLVQMGFIRNYCEGFINQLPELFYYYKMGDEERVQTMKNYVFKEKTIRDPNEMLDLFQLNSLSVEERWRCYITEATLFFGIEPEEFKEYLQDLKWDCGIRSVISKNTKMLVTQFLLRNVRMKKWQKFIALPERWTEQS
jgi:hypothetical protein